MDSFTAPAPPVAQRACDYTRVTAALDYLTEHWREQPDLDAIARAAGLSPHHFQRVFTRWVGTSPKKFVQALTHASARKALSGRRHRPGRGPGQRPVGTLAAA